MDHQADQSATGYDEDVLAWSREQAVLLRAGRFAELDIEHLADEIEDVGKSEQRELVSRMAVLLAHLLKWQLRPERRGSSWAITIRGQRKGIVRRVEKTPSLAPMLADPEWLTDAWTDAVTEFANQTSLKNAPAACPWPMDDVLTDGWLPTDAGPV